MIPHDFSITNACCIYMVDKDIDIYPHMCIHIYYTHARICVCVCIYIYMWREANAHIYSHFHCNYLM